MKGIRRWSVIPAVPQVLVSAISQNIDKSRSLRDNSLTRGKERWSQLRSSFVGIMIEKVSRFREL
jgi:hypothetical protein